MSKDLTQLLVCVAETELLVQEAGTLFSQCADVTAQKIMDLLDQEGKGYVTLLNMFDFLRRNVHIPTESQAYALFQTLDSEGQGCLNLDFFSKFFGFNQISSSQSPEDPSEPTQISSVLMKYLESLLKGLALIDQQRMTLMNIDKDILFDLIDVEKQSKLTVDSMDKFVKKNKPATSKDIRQGLSLYFKRKGYLDMDFDGFLELVMTTLIEPAKLKSIHTRHNYSEIDHLLAQKVRENQEYRQELHQFQRKRNEVLAAIDNRQQDFSQETTTISKDGRRSEAEKLKLEERLRKIREKWNLDENYQKDEAPLQRPKQVNSTVTYKSKSKKVTDQMLELRIAQFGRNQGSSGYVKRAQNTTFTSPPRREKDSRYTVTKNIDLRGNQSKIPEDLLKKYGGASKAASNNATVEVEEYFDSELGRKIQRIISKPISKNQNAYERSKLNNLLGSDDFSATSPDRLGGFKHSHTASYNNFFRDRVTSPSGKDTAAFRYLSPHETAGCIYSPRKYQGSRTKQLGTSTSGTNFSSKYTSFGNLAQDIGRMRIDLEKGGNTHYRAGFI